MNKLIEQIDEAISLASKLHPKTKEKSSILNSLLDVRNGVPEANTPTAIDDWEPFNLNQNVRVQLTEAAIKVLRANHEMLYSSHSREDKPAFRAPEVDADGYSTFAMWDFMAKFGDHVGGISLPKMFNSNILLSTEE